MRIVIKVPRFGVSLQHTYGDPARLRRAGRRGFVRGIGTRWWALWLLHVAHGVAALGLLTGRGFFNASEMALENGEHALGSGFDLRESIEHAADARFDVRRDV
jgi:hypothetical protein